MNRLLLPVATVALLIISACCWLALDARAQQPPAGPHNTEFTGKIVTVYLAKADFEHGMVLSDVEFKDLGGRMMVVGTGADTGDPNDWTRGVRIGVAWEHVETYFVMTPEQFEAKMKEVGEGEF